jgi:hypothetical protein
MCYSAIRNELGDMIGLVVRSKMLILQNEPNLRAAGRGGTAQWLAIDMILGAEEGR